MSDMEIALRLDPEKADIAIVDDGIVHANRIASGRQSGYQPFGVFLLDPVTKKPVGGLTGWADYDWLFVELFHLPESLRGQGHGRALMARAEAFARERECVGIWLDTYSFQAKPFYEKLGFTVFGTLDGHPAGGARYFMQKRL